MKIKKELEGISTSDFYYDLTSGGYIKPEEIGILNKKIKKTKNKK